MQRAISFPVFLLGGAASAVFALRMLMWAVRAPRLTSCKDIGLAFEPFASYFCFRVLVQALHRAETCYRFVSLGIGTLDIPASASLLPSPNTIISPISYILLFGYFALLAFSLFFPRPWRWSILLFVGCLFISAGFAATTYFHRAEQVSCIFLLLRLFGGILTADPLYVKYDPDGWITPDARQLLTEHGINGILGWSGTQGHSAGSRRVIAGFVARVSRARKNYLTQEKELYFTFSTARRGRPFPNKRAFTQPMQHFNLTVCLSRFFPVEGLKGSPAFAWQ